MSDLRFEWDPRNSVANWKKHGVSFEETVFSESNALVIGDPDHADDETRFVLPGLSANLRASVVCHCLSNHGDAIHLISARKADRGERELYLGRRDDA